MGETEITSLVKQVKKKIKAKQGGGKDQDGMLREGTAIQLHKA